MAWCFRTLGTCPSWSILVSPQVNRIVTVSVPIGKSIPIHVDVCTQWYTQMQIFMPLIYCLGWLIVIHIYTCAGRCSHRFCCFHRSRAEHLGPRNTCRFELLPHVGCDFGMKPDTRVLRTTTTTPTTATATATGTATAATTTRTTATQIMGIQSNPTGHFFHRSVASCCHDESLKPKGRCCHPQWLVDELGSGSPLSCNGRCAQRCALAMSLGQCGRL